MAAIRASSVSAVGLQPVETFDLGSVTRVLNLAYDRWVQVGVFLLQIKRFKIHSLSGFAKSVWRG